MLGIFLYFPFLFAIGFGTAWIFIKPSHLARHRPNPGLFVSNHVKSTLPMSGRSLRPRSKVKCPGEMLVLGCKGLRRRAEVGISGDEAARDFTSRDQTSCISLVCVECSSNSLTSAALLRIATIRGASMACLSSGKLLLLLEYKLKPPDLYIVHIQR